MRAELDPDNEGWMCLTGSPREATAVKLVPGVKWDSNRKVWRLRLSWASCLQLRGTFKDQLEVGPWLSLWSRRELEERIQPQLALRALAVTGDTDGHPNLLPFQRVGVKFLLGGKGVILGDQMGTGKTVQTIAALVAGESSGTLPALIIAPRRHSAHQWVEELATWASHLSVGLVQGNVAQRRAILKEEHDIYVLTYSTLAAHSRLAPYGNLALRRCPQHGGSPATPVPDVKCEVHPKELNRPWGTVVADEAHRIKEPKAKQTRAVWAVCADAEYRWMLTGTPIANHTADLWSLLHAVDAYEWPSRGAFLERYCVLEFNGWGGNTITGLRPENREELFKAIDPRFLRRTKAEVLPQLPPKMPAMRMDVDLPKAQRDKYDMAKKELLAELDAGTLVVTNPLTLAIRLRQLACASLKELDPGPEGEYRYGLCEPSAKLDLLEEVIEGLGGAPALVYAEYPELLNMAGRRLDKSKAATYALFHGGVPDLERDRELERWLTGRAQLLLLTLGAGAEALNLTRASHTIYLQRSWSSLVNGQSEDRTHRMGQEAPQVTYLDLVTADTIEEKVLETIVIKGERLEDVVRDKERLKELLA